MNALLQPRPVFGPPPRLPNPRRARAATEERIASRARRGITPLVRFGIGLAVALAVLLSYVTLTAQLTSMSYALAAVEHRRAQLADETSRLDDRIAELESDQHLAAVAARLDMHLPQRIAVVHLPEIASHPHQTGRTVVAAIVRWLQPRGSVVR